VASKYQRAVRMVESVLAEEGRSLQKKAQVKSPLSSGLFSTMVIRRPLSARVRAKLNPAGPAPTTTISECRFIFTAPQ